MMKKSIFLLVIFFFAIGIKGYSQIKEEGVYHIYDIIEKCDGYIIKAYNVKNKDSIQIVSKKEFVLLIFRYNKIKIDSEYHLFLERIDIKNMPPMIPGHFAIRIKKTIVWIYGRNKPEDIPYFGLNIKGLYTTSKKLSINKKQIK